MPYDNLDKLLYDYEQYTCEELIQKYRSKKQIETRLCLFELISLKQLTVIGLPPNAPFVILEHILHIIENDRIILYERQTGGFIIVTDLENGLVKY